MTGEAVGTTVIKASVLAGVGLVILLYALLVAPVGLMYNDESIYALMVDAFAANGSFLIANGYEELPLGALRLTALVEGQGGLVGKPPAGWTWLAAPLYRALGLQGLVLLSAMAMLAATGLTWALAKQLYKDRSLALEAALILLLASFLIDYAFAIWPHTLAVTVILCAALATAHAAERGSAGGFWLAALSGLLLGLGLQVRLDMIFAAPPLFLWLLARRPERPWPAAGLAGGLLPGLALLAWLNQLRFGAWSLFSYGHDKGTQDPTLYLPLFALMGVAALGVWLLALERTRPLLLNRRFAILGGAAALACLLVPGVRQYLWDLFEGVRLLVFDASGVDPETLAWRHERGAPKKALLQSLPYLALLLLPLIGALRGRQAEARGLGLLFIPLWIAPFASTLYWSGDGQNMRYFLPVLPFAAILSADAFGSARRRALPLQRHHRLALAVAIGAALAVILLVIARRQASDYQLLYLAPLPLALALGLASLWLGLAESFAWPLRTAARVVSALALIAFLWAGAMAYLYDLTFTQNTRAIRAEEAEALAAQDWTGSLLVVPITQPFVPLKLRDGDVWLAQRIANSVAGVDVLRETVSELPLLVTHALKKGRHVYFLGDPGRQEIGETIAALGYRAVEVMAIREGPIFRLAPIERRSPALTEG